MSELKSQPIASESQDPGETGEVDDAAIGRALRWSLVVFFVLGTAGGAVAWWLNQPKPVEAVTTTEIPLAGSRKLPSGLVIPAFAFTDITKTAGITFVHENGAAGEKLLPETMGSGCAFFDYDNDSDPDLLFINGSRWPWRSPSAKSATPALYRNDGDGKFTNVTATVGLDKNFYGVGVAVGDYDNDGWVDLFISCVGSNHLFHNDKGAKFTEVTTEAGVGGSPEEYSTSAAFFDLDNDGDLDLFVANYVRWNHAIDMAQFFSINGKDRAYGQPGPFEGTFPYLYRNDGNGQFTNVSADAGVQVKNRNNTAVPMAKSLGVVVVDLDGDGFQDIIVANDTVQNFLFHNQKNGKFKECGASAGIALDERGLTRGAMGIATARFRNDDTIGIAIGNFANEPSALYCTHPMPAANDTTPVLFTDDAMATGFGPQTRLFLTFGVLFCDVDLDGRLDILQANGHLEDTINTLQKSQHYEQSPQLFWNGGMEKRNEFVLVPPEKTSPDFWKPLVGRGSACADIDGDGDLDHVITTTGGAPRLLRNDQKLGNHWVRLKLEGTKCNRDAIGARINVQVKDRHYRRDVAPCCSYLSHSELPVTVGIGKAEKIDKLTIHWPDGTSQVVSDVKVDGLTKIKQTSGK